MQQITPRKTHLFTPGPTSVPDEVLRAMSAPIIHHRTAQWQEAFGRVLSGLQQVFGTEHDVAVFGASGTGAMEAAVANLVQPGDEIIVAAFGRFGMRWKAIAERYGAVVHVHETEYGHRPDPTAIAEFARQFPEARVLFTTHSETSTGAVSDAREIARSVREAAPDMLLVIDAISSLGAVEMCADEWGWDVVVAGSQKALMVPPGLSAASVSPRALEVARQTTHGRLYLDFARTIDAQRKSPPSTAVTPPVTIVLGLEVALRMMIEEEGLPQVYARHERLGSAVRAAVLALGLQLFGPDDASSCILTAVRVPDGVDGTALPAAMKQYGVTIAGGQDDLKGRIFRLGHCGWVNELDVVLLIAALERAMVQLGWPCDVGAGVAAAQRDLLSVADAAAVPA